MAPTLEMLHTLSASERAEATSASAIIVLGFPLKLTSFSDIACLLFGPGPAPFPSSTPGHRTRPPTMGQRRPGRCLRTIDAMRDAMRRFLNSSRIGASDGQNPSMCDPNLQESPLQ